MTVRFRAWAYLIISESLEKDDRPTNCIFTTQGLVDFNCLQNAIHQWIMLTVCMDASQHTLNYLIMDSYSYIFILV